MRDDLKRLQMEQAKLIKGFYPRDYAIGVNVNYKYMEDIV